MNKNRLRGSVFLKVIAFQLAIVFAACFCACAGGAVQLYGQRYYYGSGEDTQMVLRQMEQVKEYFFLHQHRDVLTPAGEERYAELTQQMSRKVTNFRFSVTRESDNRVLLSNLDEPGESYETVDGDEVSFYENGMNRMLAYYIDLDRAQDWTLQRGTAQQWAQTPYSSQYFYTQETYDGILKESKQRDSALAADLDYESFDGEGWNNEPEELEPVVEDEWTGSDTEGGNTYLYFVYTGEEDSVWMTCGIDRTYPVEDDYSAYEDQHIAMEGYFDTHFYPVVWAGVGALALFLLTLTYLTWAVGWNQEGELALRGANRMPTELAVLLGGGLMLLGLILEANSGVIGHYEYIDLVYIMTTVGVIALLFALGGMILWLVAAAQIKTNTLARRSLTVSLLRWMMKWFTRLRRAAGRTLMALPLYWRAAAGCGVYWLLFLIYYFIVDQITGLHHFLVTVFCLTLPLVPPAVLLCKWALDWARVRRGMKELVSGKLDFRLDTQRMLPDLREHGQDMNSLSEGLSLALEERMKGERFKTELITNVSHDLKTPLTSIINYVDLLKQTDIQDETARSYIEVLERKTQRLKTLTEDLVEASKAATGTIGVHLERLDVGQLIAQAAAEYDDRLTNAGLTPVVKRPEHPCTILADGRHLWRILDNLLSNCTKYAMPQTRVYLEAAEEGERCVISVKNISAQELDIPAEELMKRFVRGDSARSTEGSGLGLSIARNLAAAQGAGFDLVVDGDLFKALITFPLAKDTAEPVQ